MSIEQADTFQDMTPIEVAAPDSTGGEDQMDSFENMEPITEIPKNEEQGQAKEDESEKSEEKSPDSQVKQLDEEKEGDKEVDKGNSEKPAVDKPEVEAKSEDSDKQTEEAPKGPTVRLKNGDEATDVSQDATVKVKVNGKNEFVPIKELMTNYSGKIAYDEKFDTLTSDTKKFDSEKESFTAHTNEMVADFKEVFKRMDDPEGNPMEALTYLLDIAGKPVHTYMQKVMDHQLEELEKLQEMDETELNLYWMNKENEYLRSNQATLAKREERQNTDKELDSKLSNLMEKHGVSEEEFSKVEDELIERTGKEDVSPEDVIQYAKFKPVYEKAEGFVSKSFEDQLGDDDLGNLTAETARIMFTVGKMSEEDAVKQAAKNLGYEIEYEEDQLSQLEEKKQTSEKRAPNVQKVAAKDDDHVESFEDFNY